MSGRKLPNYDLYLNKLEDYAQACELKIEWGNGDEEGYYMPTRRKIVVDPHMTDSATIATILHELGHVLDETLYSKGLEKVMDKAYKSVYKDKSKPTRKQKARVLACERKAWQYGRGIARKLRIKLGKWYDKEEKEALLSYRQVETQNR